MYQAEYIKGGSATDPSFSSYHYDYPTQYFELVNVDCQQTKNNSQNGIIVEFSEDSEEFTTENGALVELMASLEQEPNMLAEQVIFNVFTSDASEGIVYHPTAVVFTHQNWNIPQPVVISGVYDDLDDGDQPYNISFEYSAEYTPGYSSANDPSFGRMHFKYKTQNIEIINVDSNHTNSSFNGLVVQYSPDSRQYTDESGAVVELHLTLESDFNKNTEHIIFGIATTDPTEGVVMYPSQVTFTHENWDIPQSVYIEGQYDEEVDGDTDIPLICMYHTVWVMEVWNPNVPALTPEFLV